MKYFEISDPYYALLKVEDKEQALLEYNASVAGLEDINDIHEVPEDYALVKFGTVTININKSRDPKEIINDFKDPDNRILVLDGSLL